MTPFVRRVTEHVRSGRVRIRYRHRVTELETADGQVTGARGEVLERSAAARGEPSSRVVVGDFWVSGAVVVTSGGIGANHDLVRAAWPAGWGTAPRTMLSGVPDSTDGLMLGVAQAAGARLINPDRSWHYPEGVANHSPVWSNHGIRILSGPTPLWLDATGKRLPTPLFPGFDSLGALRHITASGHDHSWFLLNKRTIGPEFGLSGSEQNPDFTNRSLTQLVRSRLAGGPTGPVQAFLDRGADFLTADTVPELVDRMNALVGEPLIDATTLEATVRERDRQVVSGLGKDPQLIATWAARRYFGDRKMRTVEPHALLDPAAGPLIAVRLHIITRKTLGGLETDLAARVMRVGGEPHPRPLRCRRGSRLRWWWHARLPRAGGHVPRRLSVLRSDRRTRRRCRREKLRPTAGPRPSQVFT